MVVTTAMFHLQIDKFGNILNCLQQFPAGSEAGCHIVSYSIQTSTGLGNILSEVFDLTDHK